MIQQHLVQVIVDPTCLDAGLEPAPSAWAASPVVTACGFLGGGIAQAFASIVLAVFRVVPCAKRGRFFGCR
jgi:hypothetical protein